METTNDAPKYLVWGLDNVAYGPVDLTVLAQWVLDERVSPETWLFVEAGKHWIKAGKMDELKLIFERNSRRTGKESSRSVSHLKDIQIGSLKRIKLFAGMEEKQLESFVQYMQVVDVGQFKDVFKKGENSDAMYLVLEGELRARVIVDGKETTLSTISVGDFFGEIALLDRGLRSADVIANSDSRLLKISAAAFEHVLTEAPALATSFLFALSKSIGARLRILTNKYQDSIHFSRLGSAVQ